MDSDEVREKIGRINRGKTFSEERRAAMREGKARSTYKFPSMSAETKAKVGAASSAKFTPEFKARQRKTMVERGHWVAESDRDDLDVYKREADWAERMWDIVDDNRGLLVSAGIFSPKTNNKGAIRDHRFSRVDGFTEGVFPEILRHPANCEIMLHAENVSKGMASSITLDKLFAEIELYCGSWSEQAKCLRLIADYQKGLRWQRN